MDVIRAEIQTEAVLMMEALTEEEVMVVSMVSPLRIRH